MTFWDVACAFMAGIAVGLLIAAYLATWDGQA